MFFSQRVALLQCVPVVPHHWFSSVADQSWAWFHPPTLIAKQLRDSKSDTYLTESYRVHVKLIWNQQTKLQLGPEFQQCRQANPSWGQLLHLECDVLEKSRNTFCSPKPTAHSLCVIQGLLIQLQEVGHGSESTLANSVLTSSKMANRMAKSVDSSAFKICPCFLPCTASMC